MTWATGTFYSDSDPAAGLNPAVAEKMMELAYSPTNRQKWIAPHVAQMVADLTPPNSPVKVVAGEKSFATNTVFGPTGLLFSVCEQMQYGYGLFPNSGDSVLMNWLGPTMNMAQERLVFKIMDWSAYVRNVSGRGSGTVWNCVPRAFAGFLPESGCEFNYCFDANRHSYVGVPGGVTPNDTLEPCITQPTINILGRRITDRVQLREFVLAKSLSEHMLDQLFTGDWTAATAGNNGQEDGILPWFTNFPTRHTELTGACLTSMSPKTWAMPTTAADLSTFLGVTVEDAPAAIAQAQEDALVLRVSQHIENVEWLLGDIDAGIELNMSDVAILMSPEDAMCVNYNQFCQIKCGPVGFMITSRAELESWYTEFQNRFRAGLYGGGVMRLRDGREVSIMPLRRIPRGTAAVLIRGWGGSSPNPYGFRLAAMQYSRWYDEVRRTVPRAADLYKLQMNGTVLRIEPQDACGDIELRWNQRLFSNAPWMQLLITGIPPCAEVPNRATWPAMPALANYVRCTAN